MAVAVRLLAGACSWLAKALKVLTGPAIYSGGYSVYARYVVNPYALGACHSSLRVRRSWSGCGGVCWWE